VGIPVFRKGAYTPIVRLLTLIPKNSCVTDCKFLELAIQSIHIFIESTGVPQLTSPQIGAYRIVLTEYKEQQKIASLFCAVEQKINLLTKKKEALETYKKGLMQKIFSQEFSNERNMLLSQICEIYDGTHQTPKYVDEGVPFYSVEHVSKDDFSKTKFITEEVFVKECQRVSIEQGDILMTRIGSVGVPKFIDWNIRASFYVSLALLKPKIEGINMEWLSYYIQSSDIQRDIWRLTIHVAFPKKINLGDMGKIRVKLPSKAVQESNYVILKSLDQKINLIIKKIKASEELKKGLLQQMFV
jgi:type I restriction enzyme S subunit